MLTNINLQRVTIGADPEVPLQDEFGRIVPCYGKLPGKKKNPFVIKDDDKFAVQRDGFMAEFNIAPASSEEEFVKNINKGLSYVNQVCREGYEYAILSTYYASDDDLDFPESRSFGCSKSYNIWTEGECGNPDRKDNRRFAGGHIHIGYEDHNKQTSIELGKLLDRYLFVPSILLDSDTERREIYGLPGSIRHTSYGFEYRPLSNFWLKNDLLIRWVYNQTIKVIEAFNNGERVSEKDGDVFIKLAYTSSNDLAQEYCQEYNINMPEVNKNICAVYGTLRPGCGNADWTFHSPEQAIAMDVRIEGFELWGSSIPGAFRQEGSSMVVDLVWYDDDTFAQVEELERGYTYDYVDIEVDGKVYNARIYLIGPNERWGEPIPNGDFHQRTGGSLYNPKQRQKALEYVSHKNKIATLNA